ncbi:ankyrin repeat domain-containing protein 50 [Battus philenor]|uniref:ankyrin repeat domain-containing protein 50 n=1 Tax=Battus philenor TaxID=42288 RepID=UPI0035CF26AB
MDRTLEDTLYQVIHIEDQDAISHLITQGANPNKVTRHGKTCLGAAAKLGSINSVKLLIDATVTNKAESQNNVPKRRNVKCYKRKLKSNSQYSETKIKYRECHLECCENIDSEIAESSNFDNNQGYYVFIHSDGSSSDESRVNLRSPVTPPSMPISPQIDLEWDEDIVNVAPTTSEDETWSSMYKWYAAILECTGAAIASASVVTNGIDQQDAFLRTALHYAVEQGHAGIVQLLINAGCKVEITAGDGLTPLHIAVMKNYVEVAKLLIAAGSNVNYKTHEKMTPLHFAASRGFYELVKILVANGAYIEARDTSERTPLYLASGRGHADIVTFLISVGSNVNGEEIHGYTPLCEAVWQRYTAVVEVLLRAGARITHSHKLLHNAIIQRQEEIVHMLTNRGAGINLHNDNGDTPLLLAARLSQPNVAHILLRKGANINCSNSITGANALHIAVENIECPKEFEELLMCLSQYNIDINNTALTGDTALNRAVLLQKDYAAVLLIKYGADVNAYDLNSCGLDNLSIAIRRESLELVHMLIKAGHYIPTPNSRDKVPKPMYMVKWLLNVCKEPLTLSDICRISIRRTCRNSNLVTYISRLPLPKRLKSFLIMEDECSEFVLHSC